ncbi:DUF2818 family protein [Pelomonas sp. KK5]|uniref:DUF2818 family protein n=1 Tax=Pelomonas sp. KK5 TaxID=1855730 RepID=UPI00097BD7C8|nr:DUF2818 family protein [Pelomonas sp. KK5]
MDQGAATWLVLLAAVVAANAPYFSKRMLLVGPRLHPKSAWWRLLELALLAVLTLMLGFALESRIGQRQPQGWEFYAAATCIFLVLGFPGFVWAYLRRHRGED